MIAETFKIQTDVFEGPLDVLLDLIEKRKLLINDVALAKVADDFITHINTLSSMPIAETAEFILVASTLVLIKSKSLLPSLELSEQEAGDIASLENRLRLYQRMKVLSEHVRVRFGQTVMFPLNPMATTPVFSPDQTLTVARVASLMKEVVARLPSAKLLPKAIVKKVISLEEMTRKLAERITKTLRMGFREFAGVGKMEKVHVIVSFLALLELVKQGMVQAHQSQDLEDINIENSRISLPSYQ
jgi:segregation and condensation protein A